ncbi:MAG: OmpA family protein [Candidatus Acidiferrales bacterium]
MMRTKFPARVLGFAILALLMSITPASAQSNAASGKLKIQVTPKQAYVFVDGVAIRDGSQTIVLSAGTHDVGVDNYGYIPKTQKVHIGAGETTDLDVTLQASGDMVSGPFGDIELKGHPRAAVLLNGVTPSYFVGHVDEFDNNWLWHQWLLVKPGSYKVTVTQKGQTVWSGPVNVQAGQRTIVYLNQNGKIETRDFKRGLTLGPQPRFDAGIASAMVPIAPPTAQLSASQTETSCGESATLNWKATDAADTSIAHIGNVPPSGDRTVSPTQTTTYELVAQGPGGEVTKTVAVNVNSQPDVTLNLSEPEVHYHKVGDKVVQDDSTTLQWSTSNANKVTITPLGSEALSGSQTIQPKPEQMTDGAVNEDFGYTIEASNACGRTASKTMLLHIVGSIDPAPSVTLASVFYPTAYPRRTRPRVGLVSSEAQTLGAAAATFKNSEQYNPQDKLVIVGRADVRGPQKYNLTLSERRAELVKAYLVSQGIAIEKIETRAEGKDQQLSAAQLQKIQSQDNEPPQKWMKNQRATWLAYNRRVDIVLEPSGQQSEQIYPNASPQARLLWERAEPSLKAVESVSKMPTASETAQAQNSGN